MEWRILPPPYLPRVLRKLAGDAGAQSWADPSHTAKWILEHPSVDRLSAARQERWRQSTLPLSDWARDIRAVEVTYLVGSDEYGETPLSLKLQVSFDGKRPLHRMDAPMSKAELAGLLPNFPRPLPRTLLELALIAPGISPDLTDEDRVDPSLANAGFFRNRLGFVTRWCSETGAFDDPAAGGESTDSERVPMPDHYLIELGFLDSNAYLLTLDGRIAYFNHETSSAADGDKGLAEFIQAFFEDPARLTEPERCGWVPHPFAHDATMMRIQERHYVVEQALRKLPYLARIAVAARALLRAEMLHKLTSPPDLYEPFIAEVRRLVEVAQRVAATGKPIQEPESELAIRRFEASVRTFPRPQFAGARAGRPDRDFDNACSRAKKPGWLLIGTCTNDSTTSTIGRDRSFPTNCVCHLLARDAQHGHDPIERLLAAILADISHLAEMNLGGHKELGRPVPVAFFSRPL